MSDLGLQVRDGIRGGFDAQRCEIGVCRVFFLGRASAHDVKRLRRGMLREVFGLERVHVANLAAVVVLIHHRGGDGDEQRGICRRAGRGACGG